MSMKPNRRPLHAEIRNDQPMMMASDVGRVTHHTSATVNTSEPTEPPTTSSGANTNIVQMVKVVAMRV